MSDKFDHLLQRAEQLIDRIEAVLPGALGQPDWTASFAFRYTSEAMAMVCWSRFANWRP